MFSKARLLLAFAFIVTGCGLQIGENAAKRTPPAYSGKGFSCVGRIPEHFDKYVNDQLSVEEITGFVSCLQKAFTTFAQLTRGSSATSYAPDEIRRFLHEFFLGERRISDHMMREFMVLKQTMLGGSGDTISREELYSAVEMLEEMKSEAIRLKPHLKVLNPRLAKTQDAGTLGKRLQEANEALNATIKTVSSRLQKNQRNYALANLQNLMAEFRIFTAWEAHFPQSIPPHKWVNFLRVFRQLTVSPSDSTVVRPVDWAPMLQSFSRWYLIFLQYEIGVKDQPILRGVGLQNAIQLGRETLNLLEQCASKHDGNNISFDQLDELTKALYDLRWIPPEIRPLSLKQTIHAVVTRILGDTEIPPSRRKAEGLSLTAISNARGMFLKWANIQLNLDARLPFPQAPDKMVPNVLTRPDSVSDLRSRQKSLGSSEWDDFLKLRGEMRPLFAEGSYRVALLRKEDMARLGLRQGFHNLTMMNIWRSVAGMLFRGYAEQSGNRFSWESGITVKELEKFYTDFREIGIDLKLVDERNPNMSSRDFTSANLFTYSADGLMLDQTTVKGQMRTVEAMELFSFLFSGGQMGKDFYTLLGERCKKETQHGPPPPLDLYARPMLPRSCVLEQLPGVFDTLLTNMPDLQQFLRLAPLPVRQTHSRILLETSFSPKFSQTKWVEFNELTTLAVIVHYAEAVMTRYDVNRDGTLTNPEIDQAAETFMGFIKKFAKEKMDKDLSDAQAKGAFYYILTYREMPSGFWDIAWLSYVSTGTLSLNRADLSTVFRVIIAKLFETGKKPEPVVRPAEAPVPCLTDMGPANCGNPVSP